MKNVIVGSFLSLLLLSCGGSGSKVDIDLYPVKAGNDYQYVDKEGKIVINPQFSKSSVFSEDLALVRTNGNDQKWGYIDTEGKFVINANYKYATVFKEGIAWVVSENGAPTAIGKDNEVLFTLNQAESVCNFVNGYASYSVVDDEGSVKWGFIDDEGKVIINPQFRKVNEFKNDLCAVMNEDGKWGFIDAEGKIKINYQFDKADSYDGDMVVVKSDDKYGVINTEGKYIINPQYEKMTIDGDMFLILQGGKFGWCDENGKILINPQFEQAFPFKGNELAVVKSGDKYGYIDSEGKFIINAQFEKAYPFSGGFAFVSTGDKFGLIDEEGSYTVNPQFDGMSSDLISMIINSKTQYNSVLTDYFNIGAITDAINFESPGGVDLGANFEKIMSKFELTEDDFSKYRKKHNVTSSQKISADAEYNLIILGNPFDKVQDGWDTKNVFNSKLKSKGYNLNILLGNKGAGKGDVVFKALISKLGSYKLIESESGDALKVYTKDNVKLKISYSDNMIQVESNIIESSDEISNLDKENYIEEEALEGISQLTEMYMINDSDGFSNLRDKPKGDIIQKVYTEDLFTVIGELNGYKKVKLLDGTVGFLHNSRVIKI